MLQRVLMLAKQNLLDRYHGSPDDLYTSAECCKLLSQGNSCLNNSGCSAELSC